MKTYKNCKSPFVQLELSSIIRGYAIFDVFRFLIILGPMLSLFYACTNIHPMPPKVILGETKRDAVDYVLYYGNRSRLSDTEQEMLAYVEKSCGKPYRDNLPSIWSDGRQTLLKALYLQGIAIVLPVTSSVCFLMFQKRDVVTSALAVVHFSFQMVAITLSLFGSYFASDGRLCFLGNFSRRISVSAMLWSLNIIFALIYKIGMLYCLQLYTEQYCRAKSLTYHPPTPQDELKSYLQELKSLGIKPKVKFELPEDPTKTMDWQYVRATTKKMLQEIRLQMAELHKDDPLVGDILKSGKLLGLNRRNLGRTGSISSVGTLGGTGPSILKIARMMASKNAEYKLLKQHRHQTQYHSGPQAGDKDDVEIILPEHNFKSDLE